MTAATTERIGSEMLASILGLSAFLVVMAGGDHFGHPPILVTSVSFTLGVSAYLVARRCLVR